MIKIEDYEKVAECIRSDQMMWEDIVKIFVDNPDFKNWYMKNSTHVGGWIDDEKD